MHFRKDVFDAIIISGDISTSGQVVDLEMARKSLYTAADGKWKKGDDTTLDLSDQPVIVIPGNHDHYNGDKPEPNPTNFKLAFSKYMPNLSANGVGYMVRVIDRSALCFVYGDLTFKNKSDAKNRPHLYGGGRVQESVVSEMVTRTWALKRSRDLSEFSVKVIWVIHFAPYECGSSLELTGKESLIGAANKAEVRHILCGHTHEKLNVSNGNLNIYCAGSATAVDCDGYIHEMDFDFKNDSFVWRDIGYSRENYEFS